ncbi:hypothetical protein KP509_12G015800 [Ceratopteris richardii]|uniref:CHHC U11-48K-type domain-containing protein n=1 Tax=Ceratopteris richardii TaxID=49495 RepID=A0A8T2TMG2_CERRI|nr:hypothetical protein KP509_12G015800 [Ceratopteris richardii]
MSNQTSMPFPASASPSPPFPTPVIVPSNSSPTPPALVPPGYVPVYNVWRAPSASQYEAHRDPPPPAVSASSPSSQQPQSFPWSPAPGVTSPLPALHASEVFPGAYPSVQHDNVMNVYRRPPYWFSSPNINSYGQKPVLTQHLGSHGHGGSPGFSYGSQCGAQNASSTSNVHHKMTYFPPYATSNEEKLSSIQQPPGESENMKSIDALHLNKIEDIDIKGLIAKLKGLITQVNGSVSKILDMVKTTRDTLPLKTSDPNPLRDTTPVSPVHGPTDERVNVSSESIGDSNYFENACTLFYDILMRSRSCLDVPEDVFYKDAPGVVRVPFFSERIRLEDMRLPDFAMGERWSEFSPHNTDAVEIYHQIGGALPASRYWKVTMEISQWKDLPLKVTHYQSKAIAGLVLVQQSHIRAWLFTHGHSYGITISNVLEDHILSLVVFCLRAVHRDVVRETNFEDTETLSECSSLAHSASWLSAQLSLLCDASSSSILILELYKFVFISAAYCSVKFLLKSSQKEKFSKDDVDNYKRCTARSKQGQENSSCTVLELSKHEFKISSRVGDGDLSLQQVASALLAIQGQAAAVMLCRSPDPLTSSTHEKLVAHSMITNRAAELRATRSNYKAVLEHDGLIWQRPQNQEDKRNKTKEELLAEERDYKRRRMSYRGKKTQRTPAEVLRDIIEGHMEEIVAAGGIGCIGRRGQDIGLSQSELSCSESDHLRMFQQVRTDTSNEGHVPDFDRQSISESRESVRKEHGSCRSSYGSVTSSSQRHDRHYHERPKRSYSQSRDYFLEREYKHTGDEGRSENVRDGLLPS